MKINKLYFTLLCLLMLFFVTGCGDKTALKAEDFKSLIENEGLIFTDITSQYKETEYILSASIASSDDWQIEYYVLDSENNARNMFNTNQSIFESFNDGSAVSTSLSLKNYSTYSLNTKNEYMYICQVDNTLLYIDVTDNYTKEVNEIIDKLGY